MSGLVRSVVHRVLPGQALRGLGCAAIRHYGAPAHAHASSGIFNFETSLACSPDAQVTTLGNGLRVATQSTSHGTATVGVYIDAGSRFETDETNGVANFVEHMVYKGSEAAAEKIGAQLGAYTSRETTAFYAHTAAGNATQALSLLGQCVASPKFDAAVMDKERESVLRQIQALQESHEELIFDNLHTSAFQGTPLARTVVGPTAHVKSLTRDHLADYAKNNFVPNRMVVAASGGVSHSDIVAAAEAAFGKLPAGAPLQVTSPRYTGSELRYRDDEVALAHVGLAFEGVGAAHPHFYVLEVARSILGSWDAGFQYADVRSSPLIAAVLHDNVSATAYRAFNRAYSDTGLFGVYMAADRLKIDDVIHEVQQELVRLALATNEADVLRGKAALKEELLSSVQGTTAACDDIGRSVLQLGRYLPLAEKIARVDAVSVADVRSVMTTYTYDKCPVVASYGPVEAVWDYNRIRSGTYWLRA